MRKRVGKLVNWLNSDGEGFTTWYYSTRISRQLYNMFARNNQDLHGFLSNMRPHFTYSDRERKDIFSAYNWIVKQATDTGLLELKFPTLWSANLDIYIQEWNDHHTDEIQEWQQQPRQVVIAAFEKYDAIAQQGKGGRR